ncbi:hypothetical protein RJ639_011780 [Escallonia herrerae]|uniref:Transglutaminase-like domain-containing protein n=1 Tax=Escallonia herrerae TaxID=1293975 RepID=A0AA89AQY3_9ASTE|nr:hypothetical protein RJ639_011780 [Escallonia herrerae]
MVARRFLVRHKDSEFDVDYDTDDGFEVLKFQLFSLTSIPPDEQKVLGGEGDRVLSDDSDLASITGKLRLVWINEEEREGEPYVANKNNGVIEERIRPYVDQVLKYEDPHRQEAARKTVPVEKVEEKALVALAKEGNFRPSKSEFDYAFLLQLLFWFKQSFRWVNAPPCDGCGNETTIHGMGVANQSETLYGASRVEVYRCNSCSSITRFPRYNDPLKLLETRKGRCGEWANCFTLYCRAFGYQSRLIMDFTDHVWTECFLPLLGRWMHLDPCEAIYDKPLLYEKGWKKSLNYVIAIAKDGVYDVTRRYTRKWHEVLSRRNLTTEAALSTFLSNLTKDCRKKFSTQELSALEERDRDEAEALERDWHSSEDASISLPGRQSGDKEWRILRAVFGSDANCSLSSSSCPVRKCIDEHVTKIYNAFCPVITELVNKHSSKSRAVEVFGSFRRILVDLKNSPYKKRRTTINSSSGGAQYFIRHMLPSFSQLFDALSLKCDLDASGTLDIFSAADPVHTSIALPVVFLALDDVIYNVNYCDNFSIDSLSWPLLKLNRICSGLILASGEELPFGIATSAFDGTHMSKWEEPNGARGCWLMYKLLGNQLHELVAYELMVLEGSEDEGSSWRVLDKQSFQNFENRFQRKTFKIRSQGLLSNAFRLRILAVRDVHATSRFQIGSIDLYAKSNHCS